MSHTYTRLLYHIVFSTKQRQSWIQDELKMDLHSYLGGILRNIEGTAIAVGGVADHVHILASIPAKISLSDALRTIKSNSSKWIHEEWSLKDFQWQEGYGAFTVSESNRESVIRYIQNQEDHHRRMSFQEEFLALLEKHGVEFDPATIWE
jgi:REP element-mobilizing transposase RayT